jgi:hypothetical protein
MPEIRVKKRLETTDQPQREEKNNLIRSESVKASGSDKYKLARLAVKQIELIKFKLTQRAANRYNLKSLQGKGRTPEGFT